MDLGRSRLPVTYVVAVLDLDQLSATTYKPAYG